MTMQTSLSSCDSLTTRNAAASFLRRIGPLTAFALLLSLGSVAKAEEPSSEAATNEPEAPRFEDDASVEPGSTSDGTEKPESKADSQPAPKHHDESQSVFDSVDGNAKNTIYLELFGPGLLYSLNYERRIQDVNLRIGFGGAAWAGSGYFVVPFGATYTGIGVRQHRLELGATGTFIFADDSFSRASTFAFQPIIGYRRESREGGYSFRAGLSPWISGSGVLPWGYVSFGFTF